MPVSDVTGTLELDVRVATFHGSHFHSPGRVEHLDVGFADGPVQRTVLGWVPMQDLEAQTLQAALDTSGMSDGWHDLSLEVVVADGPEQRFTRLVVRFVSRNGSAQPDDGASGPESVRSNAWVATEVAGASDPLYRVDTVWTDGAGGDMGLRDRRMELVGQASVQVSSTAPGESLGSCLDTRVERHDWTD